MSPAVPPNNRPAPLSLGAQQLQDIFRQVDVDTCPEHYNFHMHTLHSDGKLAPADVMTQAMAIGLKGLAITDHHSVEGYWAAQNWIQDLSWRKGNRVKSPTLWTGIEVNANLCDVDVHILGYGFHPDSPTLRPYLQGRPAKGAAYDADTVIYSLQAAGGLVILAHPARYRKPPEPLVEKAVEYGIDGIETYYAYDNPSPWRPTPKKLVQVQALAERFDLLSSCGTDTHGKSLMRRI